MRIELSSFAMSIVPPACCGQGSDQISITRLPKGTPGVAGHASATKPFGPGDALMYSGGVELRQA